MLKDNESVYRIKDGYIRDGYCQSMVAYGNKITLVSLDGVVLCDDRKNNKTIINSYIDDSRRKDMPYANIPMHTSISNNSLINYANVILKDENHYYSITDGYLCESSIVCDNSKKYIVSRILHPNIDNLSIDNNGDMVLESFTATREDLINLIGKNGADKVFYIRSNGEYLGEDFKLPSNEQLKEISLTGLRSCINEVKEFISTNDDDKLGSFLEDTGLLKFLENSASRDDIEGIRYNLFNGLLFVVRLYDDKIKIHGFNIEFLTPDKFNVGVIDLLDNDRTIEDIYHDAKHIKATKSPYIPLELNPNVTKEDIKEAKKKVKEKFN
jgi:hypothetical protein